MSYKFIKYRVLIISMFFVINLLILIVLGVLAYSDFKTREVHDIVLGLFMGLCIGSFLIAVGLDVVSFNDILIIVIVTACFLILFKHGSISDGDMGVVGIALAMPFITGVSLLFTSIFIFISEIKGIKTQPFYTLLFVAVLMTLLFYPISIENPRVCKQFDKYNYNFSSEYCTLPIVLITPIYSQTYDNQFGPNFTWENRTQFRVFEDYNLTGKI